MRWQFLPAAMLLIVIAGCTGQRVETLRDLMAYRHIVRQARETSCGAAALATVLSYYFQEPTGEDELLHVMIPKGPVPEGGLSVADLERAARAKGYQVDTYRLEFAVLRALQEPVILVLCPSAICPPGRHHFSVFTGMAGQAVHLADPARGHILLGPVAFAQRWTGIVLVLAKARPTNPTFFHHEARTFTR